MNFNDPKAASDIFMVTPKNILRVKCSFEGIKAMPGPASPPDGKPPEYWQQSKQYIAQPGLTGLNEPLVVGCTRKNQRTPVKSVTISLHTVAKNTINSPISGAIDVDNSSEVKRVGLSELQSWIDNRPPATTNRSISKKVFDSCRALGLKNLDGLRVSGGTGDGNDKGTRAIGP